MALQKPAGAPTLPQLSLHTPLGALTVSEEQGAIVAVDWGWGRDQTRTPLLQTTCEQLSAYFDGEILDFVDLPLRVNGTAYRQRVWQELRRIPRGQTRTYRDIAQAVGGSPRSIGQANGANPMPILIPCHRVVAVEGIGGYSGLGGIATKRHLLGLERAI